MPPLAGSGHTLRCLLLIVLLAFLPGCLSERSFPPHFDRLVRVANNDHLSTRAWAGRLHLAAAPLLPPGRDEALTTDQLSANGGPTDVWKRFNLHPGDLDNFFLNLRGIEQSAQCTSPATGQPAERPAWPGFHDVRVPVSGNAVLCGRLGIPDEPREIPGSFVIITHGLFGSLDGAVVMNHVQTLRRAGHHVLAIEMRGHGQTDGAHPEYAITFGPAEASDLLAAARWLRQAHHATRVGLVSFSFFGVESLLTAWLDGTAPVAELSGCPLGSLLPAHQAEPSFNGGMFLVSSPVDIFDVATRFDPHYGLFQAPVKATFQEHVSDRIDFYRRVESYRLAPGYSMWDLARCEFFHSDADALYPSFDAARADLEKFLDLSRDNWKTGAARMENIRVPVLVLNSANDPLATAQGVANLFSRQHNPNIGVILLKEGGHIGFPAYSADYYYSLMTNFFDPATAPVIAGAL